MADDEDVIYVDVVPRLDEGAADEVAGELKNKVKDATTGIGEGLKQATHDAFDQLKNAIDPKDLGTAVGQVLGDAVGDKLGSVLPDKVGDALTGAVAGNKTWGKAGEEIAKELGTQIGSKVGGFLSDSFSDLTGLDLSGLKDTVTKTLGNVTDSFSGIHDQIHATVGNVKDTLEELGLAGVAGGKLAPALTSALGPVAASIATLGPAESLVQKLPFGIGDLAQQTLPGADASLGDRVKEPFRILGGDILHPSRLGKDHQYDNLGNFVGDGPQEENGTDKLYNSVFGGGGGGGGSSSTTANEVDVTSSIATVSAGSVTLGGNISLPGGSGGGGGGGGGSSSIPASIGKGGAISGGSSGSGAGDGYSALGSYSQGGDIEGPGPVGTDSVLAMLAPGERVLTPDQNDAWKSMMHFAGGGETPSAPSGGGGESVDLGGGDSDSDSGGASDSGDGGSSDQGGDGGAPGTVSGTEAPGSVQDAADQAPQGESVDTSITDPAQTSLAGGTKTSKGIQDQSFGYGKGFQVTGQGLIGFAESAPGAIASAVGSGLGYDGSGAATGAATAALTSLWNTVGEPELNEAITQGVKVGADLASAPQQEFAVGGENFQNWSQKLIGGEIGNVTNLINTAANTQAPLTSEDGTGSAGQAAQPSGTLGGQPSPQGTPGDPIHVMPVGGASGSSQSSSMSSIGTDSSGTA